MFKSQDQRRRDDDRKTYRLAFPSDLDANRVSAWVRSISGTLRPGRSPIHGRPTISFELIATHEGITHLIRIPWQHADFIIAQLRSLVPGVRVTPEEFYPTKKWTQAVEVGLTHTSRQLRIYDAVDASASILASLQALAVGEVVIIQWVVAPAPPAHLPVQDKTSSTHIQLNALVGSRRAGKDEIKDRRQKLEEPNVLAVLRVGAKAETEPRANHLIHRVRSSYASFHSPSNRFTKRMVSKDRLQQRIDHSAGVANFPIQLSTSELTALIAFPIGNPFIAGLPQSMSRHIPVTEQVPRVGRVIGRSNMPGMERDVAISFRDACMHTQVIGSTGVGKTVMLANMLKQDIEAGHGIVLIESKGDLFHSALDYIPPERIDDVIVVDVEDTSRPVGFNILNQGNSKVVIDELTNLFEYLYQTNSVWTKEVLYHGLQTLAVDPKLSFVDLAPLLVPMTQDDAEWRDALIRSVQDKEIRNFWQRFDNQPRAAQDRITQPVMDRIWQLNARPELRNIIGQSESSFQMTDVIKNNKILLVNLSGLAGDTASLTGTLFINALWHAVKTTKVDKPNFLYLDEFQTFLKLPVDPEDMLAKARSFGLGMTLAHQHLGQLPNDLRQAVLANARSKIIFQTTSADARIMSNEFGNAVTEGDFLNLGKYEAVARVMANGGVSSPFTISTKEPAKGYGQAGAVRYKSRGVHGRSVSDVEQDIVSRRKVSKVDKPRPRPKVSGDSWGL